MRRLWVVALPLLLVACATGPFATRSAMLARADRLAADGNYGSAMAAYDAYLARHADDPEAARARASREAVASVLTTRDEIARTRDEIARLQQELARVREELAKREGDLTRVRQEADRLRADLERLKQLDLQLEKRK
jgi:septal ring factor EnvC (AmiA/AmiB activator)